MLQRWGGRNGRKGGGRLGSEAGRGGQGFEGEGEKVAMQRKE
jgi:hypothetical protein